MRLRAGGVRRGHRHGDLRLLSLDLRESRGCLIGFLYAVIACPLWAQARRNADGKIHKPAGDCIILDLLEVDRIDAGRMRG